MKSIINDQLGNELKFPKLMIHFEQSSNFVILAYGYDDNFYYGIVVWCETNEYEIGAHSEKWDNNKFEDFTGTIELSN